MSSHGKGNAKEKEQSKGRPSLFICLLIVFYILLYEWGLFEAFILREWVTAAKVLIPLLLLLVIPIKKLQSRPFRLFALFYLLFMLWGLAPGIWEGEFQVAALTWLKYLPRFVFAFLVGVYFLKQPTAAFLVMKLLVIVAVLSVIQFSLLVPAVIFDYVRGFFIGGVRGMYFGPLGILGNQSAIMTVPGFDYPVLRLTGFWLEPSNASGFMFAAFFLARVIYQSTNKLFWRITTYVCLAGGFLCLSNAGYLALAAPILFACLFMKKSGARSVYVAVLVALALGLGYFAIRGRSLANESYGDSAAMKALSGARGGSETDVYGGRVEILQKNLDVVITNPLGVGMKVSGEGGEGSYTEASASAPVLWLAYTGFVGLILLLLRETQIVLAAIKYSRESTVVMGISQAWLAMFVQHLAYGTWMSPVYLMLCVLVTAVALYQEQQMRAESIAKPQFPSLRPAWLLPKINKPAVPAPTFRAFPAEHNS